MSAKRFGDPEPNSGLQVVQLPDAPVVEWRATFDQVHPNSGVQVKIEVGAPVKGAPHGVAKYTLTKAGAETVVSPVYALAVAPRGNELGRTADGFLSGRLFADIDNKFSPPPAPVAPAADKGPA